MFHSLAYLISREGGLFTSVWGFEHCRGRVFLLDGEGGVVHKEAFIHVQTRLDLEFCLLYT